MSRRDIIIHHRFGYFKAKHAFFRFTWDDAPEDRAFVLTRYFESQLVQLEAITVYEQYAQRALIADLFGYRLWTADFLVPLTQHAAQVVRRDVTPGFVVAELIAYLNEHKIVRPGYTTLQTLISAALATERRRPCPTRARRRCYPLVVSPRRARPCGSGG